MKRQRKVHHHKGSKFMGETLCGITVDGAFIADHPARPVTCKSCMARRLRQLEDDFEQPVTPRDDGYEWRR
jgi:hypothetical protein